MSAVENLVDVHDLYATILPQTGVEHRKPTFRSGGRDMRLADVHSKVITQIVSSRDCISIRKQAGQEMAGKVWRYSLEQLEMRLRPGAEGTG